MSIRLVIVLALVAASCSATHDSADEALAISSPELVGPPAGSGLIDASGSALPIAPTAPTGPLDDESVAAVERVWVALTTQIDPVDVVAIGDSGDARLAWLLSDVLRFFQGGVVGEAAVEAFERLTGASISSLGTPSQWRKLTDLLIAWDLEPPPGYADYKKRLFKLVDSGWETFFSDPESEVDWRLVSWGGVLMDNRKLGDPDPCVRGCIPALDDPAVTDAAGGDWYPDDRIVFAVEINGEARAYPKNMMEVHEMVNDTLGGRRIGMPYCTLCGSAQAFFTDEVPAGAENLVLRTSGLLARSNKIMYELNSLSMFDTFLGVAVTGPMRAEGVVLTPVTVITTTWGDWKTAHPDTTIVAQDGGRGIDYPADPLRGRDDNGPIFPVGDVDPRLGVQTLILGLVNPDGVPIAFPAEAAKATLVAGEKIALGGVKLLMDGGGLTATLEDGSPIATHQSFWFAWSQFRPDTLVWQP